MSLTQGSANISKIITKTLRSPHLLLHIGDSIGVTIQNVQLALLNSILADIGPFFESPFPPSTDGGPIDIVTGLNILRSLTTSFMR